MEPDIHYRVRAGRPVGNDIAGRKIPHKLERWHNTLDRHFTYILLFCLHNTGQLFITTERLFIQFFTPIRHTYCPGGNLYQPPEHERTGLYSQQQQYGLPVADDVHYRRLWR